ncbi:hypothetical protein EF808_03415 [archaeon]|nr:MAG: hypothetical protein EF808_03415 [archaeon]
MEERTLASLHDEGKVTFSFKGTGEPSGNIGTITIRNESDEDLTVVIPAGTMISPADTSVQRMMVGTGTTVPLRRKEQRDVPIDDGFCADDYTKPPPRDVNITSENGSIQDPTPLAKMIDTVERNLGRGAYKATKLMNAKKARETLIQWSIWRHINPATFNKGTAKRIITRQFEARGSAPKDEAVDAGIDMLFEDIALTVKEMPSVGAAPAPAPSRPPCACRGNVRTDERSSDPDVKISRHYKDAEERAQLRRDMVDQLSKGHADITPATVAAYSQGGAAVGTYGDARAAYLFIDRPGSFWNSEWLGETEELNCDANGNTTVDITVTHEDREGCRYETVVGAAALTVVGGTAVAYDPLASTEEGYRAFEILYEVSSEAIQQEWIAQAFDAIKEATTNYNINVESEASITTQLGGQRSECSVDVEAVLEREGSTMVSDPGDLYRHDLSHSLLSDCTRGDHLRITFDGECSARVSADDGGLGVTGQESMIAYVWYWACKTITEDEETITLRWGHDWRFTVVKEDLREGEISSRETFSSNIIDQIMEQTVGWAAHNDPFDCQGIRGALEDALKQWIGRLSSELGIYSSVADDMNER